MGKVNGKIVIPSALVAVLISGLIGYGELKGNVTNLKDKDKEIKVEVKELKEKHNKDVEGINGKLDTLVNLLNGQAIAQGKLQATMEYIQKDIKDIKKQ